MLLTLCLQLKTVAKSKQKKYNITNKGYKSNKGKTSGSRVMFTSEEHGSILLHKPHPQKELKAYQVRQLCDLLEQEGLI